MTAKKLSVARIRYPGELVGLLKEHCPPPGERATVVFHETADPLEVEVAVGLGYSDFEIERILGWEKDYTISRELMFKPEYLQYHIDVHGCSSEEKALINFLWQLAIDWWGYPVTGVYFIEVDAHSPKGLLLQLQRQEVPGLQMPWDTTLDIVKAFAEQSPNLEVARRRWAAVGEVGLLTREAQEKCPNCKLEWKIYWLPTRQCLRLILVTEGDVVPSVLKVLDIP